MSYQNTIPFLEFSLIFCAFIFFYLFLTSGGRKRVDKNGLWLGIPSAYFALGTFLYLYAIWARNPEGAGHLATLIAGTIGVVATLVASIYAIRIANVAKRIAEDEKDLQTLNRLESFFSSSYSTSADFAMKLQQLVNCLASLDISKYQFRLFLIRNFSKENNNLELVNFVENIINEENYEFFVDDDGYKHVDQDSIAFFRDLEEEGFYIDSGRLVFKERNGHIVKDFNLENIKESVACQFEEDRTKVLRRIEELKLSFDSSLKIYSSRAIRSCFDKRNVLPNDEVILSILLIELYDNWSDRNKALNSLGSFVNNVYMIKDLSKRIKKMYFQRDPKYISFRSIYSDSALLFAFFLSPHKNISISSLIDLCSSLNSLFSGFFTNDQFKYFLNQLVSNSPRRSSDGNDQDYSKMVMPLKSVDTTQVLSENLQHLFRDFSSSGDFVDNLFSVFLPKLYKDSSIENIKLMDYENDISFDEEIQQFYDFLGQLGFFGKERYFLGSLKPEAKVKLESIIHEYSDFL